MESEEQTEADMFFAEKEDVERQHLDEFYDNLTKARECDPLSCAQLKKMIDDAICILDQAIMLRKSIDPRSIHWILLYVLFRWNERSVDKLFGEARKQQKALKDIVWLLPRMRKALGIPPRRLEEVVESHPKVKNLRQLKQLLPLISDTFHDLKTMLSSNPTEPPGLNPDVVEMIKIVDSSVKPPGDDSGQLLSWAIESEVTVDAMDMRVKRL